MVKREFVSVQRGEIVELCERLGHDPARVARITIEPHVVIVEYEHPVLADPTEHTPEVRHDDGATQL